MEARADPFEHFAVWFAEAQAADPQPEAVALATTGEDGRPSNRVVLVRQFSARGFEFFTDRESLKGRELGCTPYAALAWHWKPLERQVRASGRVERLTDEECEAYWAERPRGSRLSATVSRQSQPIASREALLDRRSEVEAELRDEPIPRPERWGGYRLVPDRVEFWQHDEFRLHDRLQYFRDGELSAWSTRVLQP
jgi:pyridoxamine 5'-phosphate oxidase